MKVKELSKLLKGLDPNMEVGIKWLYSISPVTAAGVVLLSEDFDVLSKEDRKIQYLILSPFDVDPDKKYDFV